MNFRAAFSKKKTKNWAGEPVSFNIPGMKLIDEYGLYELEDSNPIFYGRMDTPSSLLWACSEISFSQSRRTNGMPSNVCLFGAKPSIRLRDNFCSQAMMAGKNPEANQIFKDFGIEIAETYKREFPEIYKKNLFRLKQKGKAILPEYIIDKTPFTSGVVNKENALGYHFDSGNFSGMQSAMIVLCNNIIGGHLVLPEYNVAFKIKNNTLIMFNGQNVLHGVSPIRKCDVRAYRYSIVYYSMERLWKCLTMEEEIIKYNEQ